MLLDAVTDLDSVEVTVIGDGPQRAALEVRITEAALHNVTLVGRVSDTELWEAYSSHDVVVLPSLTNAEAYGLVLAEGMAAGCVPVASDLPGVRAVAGPTGVLVRPGDAGDLRSALSQLSVDRARLERLAQASSARGGSMSVETVAERHEDVFSRVLSRVDSQHAESALPPGWESPNHLLSELANRLELGRASISLAQLDSRKSAARIWHHGVDASRVRDAPILRYVAARSQPLLLHERQLAEPDLGRLLQRPELTSSIVVPLRRTGRGVSLLSVATTASARSSLDSTHLAMILDLLDKGGRSAA